MCALQDVVVDALEEYLYSTDAADFDPKELVHLCRKKTKTLQDQACHTESKPTEYKSTESKLAEYKSTESKPAESKSTESKPAEPNPAELKPTESKSIESKSV